jgi:hypothetical protein
MNFKSYLQGHVEESPFSDPQVRAEINHALMSEIDDTIMMTPESGVQRMRKVLSRYSIDFPAFEDLDTDGDESIYELDAGVYLYFIYYLTDDGNYEFHAEITNDEGIEEILSDVEEDTEE